MIETTKIKLSKGKIIIHALASITFIIIGFRLLLQPSGETNSEGFSESGTALLQQGLGIIAILFFGGSLFVICSKLFRKYGLIINSDGIINNTNLAKLGLIEWSDITDIHTFKVSSTRFLIIRVKDPLKYLNRASNAYSKKILQMNIRQYGSPITIISNSIGMKFDELSTLLSSSWEASKRQKP